MAKNKKAFNTADDDAIAVRRVETLRLRVESKMTMREIAQHLSVSVGTVHRDIRMLIEEEEAEGEKLAETARAIEDRRLDLWLAKIMRRLDNEEDVDKMVKLVTTALRTSERRSKLLGLDAPTKSELTGKDGEPVAGPVIYIPPESDS